MEVTETASDGLKRELKVVIGAKELDRRLSKRLDELKDEVRLKGFRPGKVPVNHLRKVYGRSVMAEVLQQAVAETSQKAISDRAERPAFQPDIALPDDEGEIENVMSGKADLAYTMSFEVLPEFEVADFAKLKLEKLAAEVQDSEIDKGVEQLLEGSVSYQPKEGSAKLGDQLTLDFVGKIDGETFDGGAAEDATVVLGRGRFIPGFEEGLAAAKAGETRTVETTFPDDYPAEHLAGKKAAFDVTIKQVAAPVKPEANDEFAKTIGFESLADLRAAVEKKLASDLAAASRAKLKRDLLDKLDEDHAFVLPATLVDSEFETIWRQVTADMERSGSTFEKEGTSEEKARKRYQEIAARRVRLALVLSKIGEKNDIKVTDEEVNNALMERVRQFPGRERAVFEFYKKNPQAVAELRAPIFEDKVVDYILELVKVSEKKVSGEELFKVSQEDEMSQEEDEA